MYDPVEFFAAHGVAELWNTACALRPGSTLFGMHIGKVAKRAVAARRGRQVGVREYNTMRSNVMHDAHA
jgi:hypothetical protein